MGGSEPPLLYGRLAEWWPLLSAPADYAEEAAVYRHVLVDLGCRPDADVLELGCGGGNNASHLKGTFHMTLTDLSPRMLEVSRRLNPECEHVQGDMRTLRLGRTFDAVFVHDAIGYVTSEDDLAAAFETIAVHLAAGGAFLVAADHVAETFSESTDHGGSDGDGRSLRYLEWTHDPDPADTTYLVDFAYLLREGTDVAVEHDRHVNGLFPRPTWLASIERAGLDGRSITHTFSDGSTCEIFAGTKRGRSD